MMEVSARFAVRCGRKCICSETHLLLLKCGNGFDEGFEIRYTLCEAVEAGGYVRCSLLGTANAADCCEDERRLGEHRCNNLVFELDEGTE